MTKFTTNKKKLKKKRKKKNPSVMQEVCVWSLGREDPLEEEMAILSSIFAWEIPRTVETGGLQCMGLQRIRYNWANNTRIKHSRFSLSVLSDLWRLPSALSNSDTVLQTLYFTDSIICGSCPPLIAEDPEAQRDKQICQGHRWKTSFQCRTGTSKSLLFSCARSPSSLSLLLHWWEVKKLLG